jgi:hypothetical protein
MLGFGAVGGLALGQLPPAGVGGSVNEDSWHQPFSTDMVRRLPPYAAARQQFAAFVQFSFAGVFTPALSKWAPQFSEPARRLKPMHTGAQQFASFVQFAPFAEFPSADKWFMPFSEPVRFRPRMTTAHQWFGRGIEFPLTTSIVQLRSSLLGTAVIGGVPTSNYKSILASGNKRRLIFAAELSPWTLSQ